MPFVIGDKVKLGDGREGVVSRLNLLGTQKSQSVEVTLADNTKLAFFGDAQLAQLVKA